MQQVCVLCDQRKLPREHFGARTWKYITFEQHLESYCKPFRWVQPEPSLASTQSLQHQCKAPVASFRQQARPSSFFDAVAGGHRCTAVCFSRELFQIWCGTARPESYINAIATGRHSPGRFRCVHKALMAGPHCWFMTLQWTGPRSGPVHGLEHGLAPLVIWFWVVLGEPTLSKFGTSNLRALQW